MASPPSSRSNSPPPQDLWSSILDSVSSSRAIPSKNVVLLGEPLSGKSTLAQHLLQKKDNSDANGKDVDFAIGYDWADVRDEGDEDTLARLSVYTVPSSAPAHLSLLPHFLPPKTSLTNSLVMIVLDWTKPWSFVDQLETWMEWVNTWVKGDGARDLEVAREEGRERLQAHLQHYTEPANPGDSTTAPVATSSLSSTLLLPLGPGTMTNNLAGLPIVVVCTKADQIDGTEDTVGLGMVKGKGGEWEERTDGIMQVLRTVCLKYGAALFYTTTQPAVLSVLRSYVLHFLFMAPFVQPGETAIPHKNPFPFNARPNTLDRDRIVVPAGWDSWGKIGVLRDGFDAQRWGEAWDKDLEEGVVGGGGGAREMYRVLVGGDEGPKRPPLPALITTEPDQAFLSKHYEALQKDPNRDPRAQFRPDPATTPAAGAGVVGPMGSSSFSLPSVEKAMMDMDGDDVSAKLARMAGASRSRAQMASALTNPPSSGLGQTSMPPPLNRSSTSGGSQQNEHQVLQNFFQSLLNTRRDSTPAGGASGANANPAPGDTSGSSS
ncbi:Cytoplasmic dynein 1 light intermediate chain 2 [Rhizoctonia solani]|uniref:Cytoplasmic dynein 1 light intermediate chain 2 n=1 Tax=Rhizoctonia solani TaxID=456999 RepID=A0A0K6FTP5_9AGAM|nr:Cytoplasmic dynein 1 light intermediate chain 2 [Rhizoctonia solani]